MPGPRHEELPRTADKDALDASWQGEAPVLCLAGRWPLDEATSTMLAQLLEKHGLGGPVESYSASSRSGIETLDMTGVAMICVSYLDITGSPAHLRYQCLPILAADRRWRCVPRPGSLGAATCE